MNRTQADVCPEKNYTAGSTPVAVGVCGFGRCGSTMVMEMLAAGGIPTVAGAHPRSHELTVDAPHPLTADLLDGHAVKLLDQILHPVGPDTLVTRRDVGWRFVWLDRNPREQSRSHLKFTTALGLPARPGAVTRLRRSYAEDRPVALDLLRAIGPVLELRYERVLRDPVDAAHQLRDFLWPLHDGHFKIWPAQQAVHRRDGACLPDLAFELGGTA